MRRFEQEAIAASSLNHPNIMTVYEVDEHDGAPFITAEVVEGVTLKQRMAGKAMKITEALDVGIQIASALAAAHAAKIVHRDIKPENIMLRGDGIVKVLDFGLAKLAPVSAHEQVNDADAETKPMVNTEPGMVMGTVAYMSPEQARGAEVDERTDIWSLGVVLYEMVAGHAPFDGATRSDLIAAVLKDEPTSLQHDSPEVPVQLQRIVRKALQKQREQRYQRVDEVIHDLQNLRRKRAVAAESDQHSFIADNTEFDDGPEEEALSTDQIRKLHTDRTVKAQPTIINDEKTGANGHHRQRRRRLFGAFLLCLMMGGAAFFWYKFNARETRPPANPLPSVNLTRLTASGKTRRVAAVSPDGKYVAYVVGDGAKQRLLMRQVATTGTITIIPPERVDYVGLSFSQNGDHLYYARYEQEYPLGVLYQVSVLGGDTRKILEHINSHATFSPDGERFAFIRTNPDLGESSLMVVNSDGSGEPQKLAVRKSPDNFGTPSWSPKGKVIACSVRNHSVGQDMSLVEIQVDNGAQRPLSSAQWAWIGRVEWLADGSELIIVAQDEAFDQKQIWRLSYRSGEARRITNDLNDYESVSLTADSNTLVSVQTDARLSIWTMDLAKAVAGPAKQITSNRSDGMGLAWTPDEKIIYRSLAAGNPDLWIAGADGSGEKQLTHHPSADFQPVVTPDGSVVVFASERAGGHSIWRMDADGGNQIQLTSGKRDDEPACSPDGKWVAYTSWSGIKPTLWKVPLDGGDDPVRLTDYYSTSPVISPDGRMIACSYRAEQTKLQWKTAFIPVAGGPPSKVLNLHSAVVRWAVDSQSIFYVETREGVSNIWSRSLDDKKVVQVTNFTADRISSFDVSRDGKKLAVTRNTQIGDVVLMKDFVSNLPK
ncbi:MAG: protein kinase [Pyrinomonadaceae bacterium]